MASTRTKLDEIVASFSTLEDPRSHINRRHPLPSILVVAVLAVLAGAAGPTAIARWAKYKEELLMGLLDLPNGIPGKDVFRRVLMIIKPARASAHLNDGIKGLRKSDLWGLRQNRGLSGIWRLLWSHSVCRSSRQAPRNEPRGSKPFSGFLADSVRTFPSTTKGALALGCVQPRSDPL